jgi:hypothetical protein
MKQFKIVLPEDLRARLDAAIAKSGRSIADEIRTRVEQSLDLDDAAVDKPTREFLDRLALMPAEIGQEIGVWHKYEDAWKALWHAIQDELAQKRPPTGTFGPRLHRTTPSDDLEYIGKWSALQLRLDPGYTKSQQRRSSEEMFRKYQASRGKKS